MAEQKLLKRKKKFLSENNQNPLAAVCIDLAELYSREGRYHESIKEYEIVAKIYNDQKNYIDYARANRMIGETYNHLREFNKALTYQEIHLGVAKEQGDKLEEQRALATIGHTYLTSFLDVVDNPNKRSLNLAHKAFMRSLNICECLTGISKREHMDIKSRLLANMGVVQECLGDYEQGIELVKKSIAICKANDIFEQLERGYTFLASLYARKTEYSEAIRYYNQAIEVAERLDDKISLVCTSLNAKSDLMVKLGDFQRAKSVLKKAYKLKTPNTVERNNIETNLRIVTAMCYAEESLLIAGDCDYVLKKQLYEKLGDGACVLRNYAKAIEFYKKMLECAEKNGDSGKELSPCYVSLAQTYKDKGDYDEAAEYFKNDYKVWKDNVNQSLSSMYSLIECTILKGNDFNDVLLLFEQCRSDCRAVGDKKLEGRVIVRLINTLKQLGRLGDIKKWENELEVLSYVQSSDSESDPDEPTTQNIGDDIDLSLLTDESDSDEEKTTRNTRKRTKPFSIKRNNKGETQLHTACITGNAILVRKLLEQGHTVNVRDNCGWLPIHEACICGHLEIVTMLVEKGAWINDRGGNMCNGMTPLHDAASNGHLNIIEYMLDKGAFAVAKTDDGDTPLSILKAWREGVNLDAVQQSYYEVIIKRMMDAFNKIGETEINVSNKENKALILHSSQRQINVSNRNVRHSVLKRNSDPNAFGNLRRCINDSDSNIDYRSDDDVIIDDSPTNDLSNNVLQHGNLRRHTDYDSDNKNDSDSDNTNSSGYFEILKPNNSSAANEYKEVMNTLRHRNTVEESKKRKSSMLKKSALLQPNEVGDDWLEDDLMINLSKKRKTSNELTSTLSIRKSPVKKSAPTQKSPIKKSSPYKNSSPEKINIIEDESSNDSIINSTQLPPSKKKRQSKLTLSGFTRKQSMSPINYPTSVVNYPTKKKQTKLTQFSEPDSTSDVLSTQKLINKMLSIDVRIEEKLFRIPVPMSELDTLTMKWLADEATKRFYKKEAMKPTIELETKNGALLADDDFISMLFPIGGHQSEEVHARIVKWNIPPITERYAEACQNLGIAPNTRIQEIIESTTVSLNLQNELLRKSIHPVCSCLNRQTNLYELNLRGNCMEDRGVELLCDSLPTLTNLAVLDLSANNLTGESLRYMCSMLHGKEALGNLQSLDLSYNCLKDDGFKSLAVLTSKTGLKKLKLRAVGFTENIFQLFCNQGVKLSVKGLEEFDVSFNELNCGNLITFLQWLDYDVIRSLNIGNNRVIESGLGAELIKLQNVKVLNVNNCRLTDEDVNELISNVSLDELDIQSSTITSNTFTKLLADASLTKLDVSHCPHILENFKCSVTTCQTLITTLDYMENYSECDILIELWREKYQHLADARGLHMQMLRLSVKSE